VTHGHEHDSQGRGHHGPAHSGAWSSAEPGGFDEYDHPTFAPGDGPDPDAVNTEAVNDEPVSAATQPSPASQPSAPEPGPASASAPSGDVAAETEGTGIPVVSDGTAGEGDGAELPLVAPLVGDAALAAERLEDLRRLQAEYVNYKKRVDRDRSVARDQGISHVLESMLPVLDEIHLAREHGDLDSGPAATIVDKLEAVLAKLGIERFGAPGDEFDPNHHEALMRMESDLPEGTTATTVVQVLQPGYRLGDRVVRAARVAVADPQ